MRGTGQADKHKDRATDTMMNFFEQGLLHPLAASAHLIVLLALGLLAGQQGRGCVWRQWGCWPSRWRWRPLLLCR
ncbi:MAG: HupE/UreJ family protein [Thiolinea sp.]